MCLKKCSSCSLQCIKNAQHTEEMKLALEKKKEDLIKLQATLKTIPSENLGEKLKKRHEDYLAAKTREDDLHKQMVRLTVELKHLSDKENLEVTIRQYDSDLAAEKAKIDNLTSRIKEIRQQLKNLLSLKDELTNISELSHRLNADVKQLMNVDQHKVDHLNKLVEKFHQNDEIDSIYKNKLFCISPKQEHTNEIESTNNFELNTSLSTKIITSCSEDICNYSKFFQQCLKTIKEKLNTEQQHLADSDMQTKEIEQQLTSAQIEKENISNSIETMKTECEKLDEQLLQITTEQEALLRELEEKDQSDDIKTSSEIQKLKHYVKDLQDKLNIHASTSFNRLKDQNQKISNINQKFNLQKIKHRIHVQNFENITKLNEIGTQLGQSLREDETSLNTTLKILNKIIEIEKLINEHILSSGSLTLAFSKQNGLNTHRDDLVQELNIKKNSNFTCQYTNTEACKKQYDTIAEDYDKAHSQTERLKQELTDMGFYSGLKNEIINLERQAQENCSCGTDHKCSGICRICLEGDKAKQNKCMFSAGHTGDHKCDADHVCTQLCQICEIYGFPNKRCVFPFKHSEPIHHQCERSHQCPATCVCSDPCTILLEIEPHGIRRCNKQDCWKPCILSCGSLCATQDHNHDDNSAMVLITIGNDVHEMKKHLCNQSHYCKGICNAPGVCKLEYKEQRRKWTTECGTEFTYDHVEVEEVRAKCEIKIDVGKTSHDEMKNHICDGQHTCSERCPDCGSFYRNSIGHDGNHRTLHRKKDQHILTSRNPAERIEILSDQPKTYGRTYKVGESAKPENCSASCKRRGRSHFHLVECPGGLNCWEKIFENKAKHSNDTYYYGSENPTVETYDEILCSIYWSLNKWDSPVNAAEQKVIDSCNAYCAKHIERDKNSDIRR